MHIAAVATARKLAVLCWHLIVKGEDYAFAQPSLVAHKRRKLELRAGHVSARGRKGTASGYSLTAVRTAERQLAAQAENAYRTMVAAWQPRKPTPGTQNPRRGIGGERGCHQRGATIQSLTGQRGAAELTAPYPALCDEVEPRPPPPDATPVLAEVKVVRPAGRSTLTSAPDQRLKPLPPDERNGSKNKPHLAECSRLTISSVAYCSTM
jgi:hypothetical protein